MGDKGAVQKLCKELKCTSITSYFNYEICIGLSFEQYTDFPKMKSLEKQPNFNSQFYLIFEEYYHTEIKIRV